MNELKYFENLTYDPQDIIMTIEDMEKTIQLHESGLSEEDKRVEETDQHPNYGEDFAAMVHIARSLLDTVKAIKQECDVARRTLCYEYYLARNCRVPPELIAEEMGWDCFGEGWKMTQDALDRIAQLGEEIENEET